MGIFSSVVQESGSCKKKKIKKNLPNQSETSFLLKKIWIKGAVENNEELEA